MEDKYDLDNSSTASLARLFELTSDPGDPLGEEDLAAVLRHQLDAPLAVDLKEVAPDIAEILSQNTPSDGGSLQTFRDVLIHPEAAIELLVMVKDFSKHAVQSELDRERDIAGILYLASISAAQLHCGETISSLGEEWQLFNLRRFKDEPWLDADIRTLFESALSVLESSS